MRRGVREDVGAHEVRASRSGFVTAVDALAVGRAAQLAGAGRRRIDDTVDSAAGVVLERTVGDEVAKGDPLAAVFSRDPARRSQAGAVLEEAFTVGEMCPAAQPVVLGRE